MRFYAMGNYYLSSIQQGIQAAHALGDMVVNSKTDSSEKQKVLTEWLYFHKTMVLLNGGNSANLRDLWTLLSDERNTLFPVSKFSEDEQSLDGALTCVAIVLPERLYNADWVRLFNKEFGKDDGYWADSSGEKIKGWEAELLTVIKRLPLAR